MIKEVIQIGSPILTTWCKTINNFNAVQGLIKDLNDTIDYLKTTYSFTRGIGLAAPQIGENLRITVIEFANKQRHILINPEIVKTSKEKIPIREGCISFLKYRGLTPRYTFVKVKTYDQGGKEYFLEGVGDAAMLLQHEIDHINGILYTSHLPNGEKDFFVKE